MRNMIRKWLGITPPRQRASASYDAAKRTTENASHWASADHLSINAQNSPDVRRTLRIRVRHEVANNSYARGIADTLAYYTVGTGPRLQVITKNEADNDRVEELFHEWANIIDLPSKLRTMRYARVQDGEAFARLIDNPTLPSRVKLDVRLYEADQIAHPTLTSSPTYSDGIYYDSFGNPAAYSVLRVHPGESAFASIGGEADRIEASMMLHYFVANRPGQMRGIPEFTPCLNLLAMLRRYELAVLAAAETAADFALVIRSQGPASEDTIQTLPMLAEIPLERRMATVLPDGYDVGGLKPEQPTTVYGEYVASLLTELGRPFSMPYNLVSGTSERLNYASGRLDHQAFARAVAVEQSRMEHAVLNRILNAWIREASLVEGLIPEQFRRIESVKRQWFWDGSEHVDPLKEADAQETRLRAHTTTLAEEYGKRGKDWRQELAQAGEEAKEMKRLGLDAAPNGFAPSRRPAQTPEK